MSVSDEVLIRALVRDREKIFAYCWAILRDDDLAEDVFQEVCSLAVQKRETIANEQHLAGWLRLAARRKSMEAARARSVRAQLFNTELLDLLDAHWRKWDESAPTGLLDALRHCLKQLNPRGRELLAMRYEQGLKSPRIAEKLGCKVPTIYMATMRIHAKLKECIVRRMAIID